MSAPRGLRLLTPENVALRFALAPVGARILAITLDMGVVLLSVLLIALVASLATPASSVTSGQGAGGWIEVSDSGLWLETIVMLAAFFIWNFYFIVSELRWQGRTLGKRAARIRVIARDGGPLSANLVFARNLTRDLELLFPLLAIFFPQALGLDDDAPFLLTWLWLGIMALMPLFNRHRSRVGDLVAGTVVVTAPKPALLQDLAADGDTARAVAAGQMRFTQAQLDIYGIHELQILEDILRRYPSGIDPSVLQGITDKICAKIDWSGPAPDDPHRFLKGFYTAQRARLEHKLLLGRRHERKAR